MPASTPAVARERLGFRHDIEFYPQLILHLYRPASDAHRFDSEVPLFQLRRALEMTILRLDVQLQRMGLAVQGEISAHGPAAGARGLDCG